MSTMRIYAERSAVARAANLFYPPLSLVPAPPASDPPASAASTRACLNCREPVLGKYCHACGQALKTKRFDLKGVLHEIPHEVWHLDHALPHTLKALFTKPGHTIRRYLAGERAHTYSPLALLFLVGSLLFFAKSALHVHGDLGEARHVTQALAKYNTWIEVLSAPLSAVAPYLLLRKRTGLTYSEQLVAALMISVGVLAISLAFVPVLWAVKAPRAHDFIVAASYMSTFAYSVWAYAGLQDDGTRNDPGARWSRAVGGAVGTFGVYAVAVVGSILIFLLCLVGATLFSYLLLPIHRATGIGISPRGVVWSAGHVLEAFGRFCIT